MNWDVVKCKITLDTVGSDSDDRSSEFFEEEYFFFVGAEFFAVKIIKDSSFGLEAEFKPVCVECLEFVAETLIFAVDAVFAVAEKRMAYGGKVSAYLMCTAGDELHLKKGKILCSVDHLIFGDDLLVSGTRDGYNVNYIVCAVLFQVALQRVGRFFRDSVNCGEIEL